MKDLFISRMVINFLLYGLIIGLITHEVRLNGCYTDNGNISSIDTYITVGILFPITIYMGETSNIEICEK